jgi:protein TonB
MAREVNLSSREWCDLVFEGKNKDFGAYVIRTDSSRRHNKAVLLTIIGSIIFGLLAFGYVKANQYLEERWLADQAGQEGVIIDMRPDAEESEPEQEILEEKKPEVLPEEEILNTIKVTELAIVEDNMVSEEDKIMTQDEIIAAQTAFGATNYDQGTDNLNVSNTNVNVVVVEPPVDRPVEVEQKVFTSVEQMPQFPGGEAALMKFLQSHINYPPMAAENNVQGRVVVQFVVEKNGNIGEVKVVRSVDKDLDKEAVRVCKSLPKFTPGRQNGQAVPVWFTLPVTFKLQGTN